jgi:hypothetical protein
MGDYVNYAITGLNLLCCVVEALSGNWNRAVYWLGGVLLTGSILFMK